MSRPKKTILLFDPNEQSHSRNRFLLKTRGYRVLSARDLPAAQDIVATAYQDRVDLIWANAAVLAQAEDLIRPAKASYPELRVLVTVTYTPSLEHAQATTADLVLHGDNNIPAIILHRIHLLTTRKRGPKKRTPIPAQAHTEARSAA